MPRLYKGICQNCGRVYEGEGKYFCSYRCRYAFQRRQSRKEANLIENLNNANDTELFDEATYRAERKKIYDTLADGKPKRILNITDMHIPFQNPKVLTAALKEDADVCVISEPMDLYKYSGFRKEKYIPIERELMNARVIFDEIRKKYRYVVIQDCNHSRRLLKVIQSRLESFPELAILIKKSKVLDLVQLIFPEGVDNFLITGSWWCQIGKTIFCHPDYYSKAPLKTVQNSYEFFTTLPEQSFLSEWDAIVNSHTHHGGMIPYKWKWLIENPCSCYLMDYILAGKKHNAEWHYGYSIVEQDKEGNFLPNRSRPYFVK